MECGDDCACAHVGCDLGARQCQPHPRCRRGDNDDTRDRRIEDRRSRRGLSARNKRTGTGHRHASRRPARSSAGRDCHVAHRVGAVRGDNARRSAANGCHRAVRASGHAVCGVTHRVAADKTRTCLHDVRSGGKRPREGRCRIQSRPVSALAGVPAIGLVPTASILGRRAAAPMTRAAVPCPITIAVGVKPAFEFRRHRQGQPPPAGSPHNVIGSRYVCWK
jgi:hypothetical protein